MNYLDLLALMVLIWGISIYPDCSGSTSAANIQERDDAEIVQCQMKTIDSFVADNKLVVDFIKCDVEGAELFVYQGGIEAIKAYKPIIFSEMLRKWTAKFNYSPNSIIDLLSNCGYKCFTTHGGNLIEFDKMDERTVETNFFFLHKIKHLAEIKALVK